MKVLDVHPFQDGLRRNIAMLDRIGNEMGVIQRSIEGLVAMEDSLKGEGGQAIRKFYAECHLPFLQFVQLFQNRFTTVLKQMEMALDSLEPDPSGYIREDFLEGEIEQGLQHIARLTESLTDETNSIMNQVADIVSLPHLDDSEVQFGIRNATMKRNDTVMQLHEFDATHMNALMPIEQDLATMEAWIMNMEGLFSDGLTDIHFSADRWAELSSQNTLKTDLAQQTAAIAGLPGMTSVNGQLATILGALLAGPNLIRFGYGFVSGPNPLYELGILLFPGMATYGKQIPEVNGESLPNEEQVNVFVSEGEELSPEEVAQLINYLKKTDFDDPNRKSGTQPLPPYDEEITFEGMRKVVGGNGSGTPDGLAPYAMGTFDFFTEDIRTMFSADATAIEQLEAAAFTFIKPAKGLDTVHDAWKVGEKAKDAGKGRDKTRPSWRQSEIDVEKDFSEYNAQKSFKDGIEVPYGEKGSSRPDLYQTGHSIEVKNYKITTSSGRSSLVNNVSKQVEKRLSDLPSNTKQSVIIDIRGQNVSDEILDDLYEKIMNKTNSKVDIRFKTN